MVARVRTVAFQGVDVVDVDVQVQISSGLPAFSIVGLPDKAVAESRDRVRAALSSIGLALPPKRITVNLSPADLPKEGSHFDLPIALGLLAAMNVVPMDAVDNATALGELALDGILTRVDGVLPAAVHSAEQGRGLICPAACGGEAAWASSVEILAPGGLLELVNHFKGTQVLASPEPEAAPPAPAGPDLKDIKGQESAKRALEVAAAGGHNLLLVGPPGAGKSMLAATLPGLLPPLTPAEALDVSKIASIAGELRDGRISQRRPYRCPHHSTSVAAMIGGGLRTRPGEISLAHFGALFLDELPEFPRAVLESLRQPLETGSVVVARANAHVTYPARFQLIAAMNPCRCGHLDDPAIACSRAPKCAHDYQAKISGPLLDRFDIILDVPAVSVGDLSLPNAAEGNAEVAARVQRARTIQNRRFAAGSAPAGVRTNSDADGQLLEEIMLLDSTGQDLLTRSAEAMHLSARGYHRVLRVARTLADLDGSDRTSRTHIAEAASYRQPMRR